jgi:hypothetical protein
MMHKKITSDPWFSAAAGCRRWKEPATYADILRIELVDGLQPVL